MVIYGKQVCLYALEYHPEIVHTVYVAKKGVLPQSLFHQFHGKVKFLEEKWAQSLSKGGNHQGILLEVDDFRTVTLSEAKQSDFVVMLDGLTDVGNIGAIVRSAYALGVDAVVATGVKQLNFPAIVRTSSGALLDMLFVLQHNILDACNELRQAGFRLYGAAMDGKPAQEVTFAPKRTLILGSEDRGLSKKVLSKLDEKITIKMKHDFDSLNVSAAAAILIHRMDYAVE